MFTTFETTATCAVLGTVGTALCAGLYLFAANAPANAAEPARTTTVRYADLDVHTAQGRAALDRRIAAAARSVCTAVDTGPIAQAQEARYVRKALAAARPTIG